MVSGKHKSRSLRKVFVKTPSETKVHYRKRNPKVAKCSCGAVLKGIPRLIASKFKKLSKGRKTVSRPYGGNLCTKCMREKIIGQVREV
jgi:large subunit ribosomal protein L34e